MKANSREFRGIVLIALSVEFLLTGMYGQYAQVDIFSSLMWFKPYCFPLQAIGVTLFVIALLHLFIDVEVPKE